MVHDYDDDIIELTDVVTEDSSQEDQEIIELTQVAPDPEETIPDASSIPEESIMEEPVSPLPEKEPASPSLDRETFEAVLEKIIEKKFSETIEKILFEVMERVIKREIEDIKAGLKKDLDDIG